MTTKKCTKCSAEKSFEEFPKSSTGKFGLYGWCRPCCSVYARDKREAANAKLLAGAAVRYGDFGAEIRRARNRLGLTQIGFGAKVGVGGHQVRIWEKGVCLPRGKKVARVCSVLGIEPPVRLKLHDPGRRTVLGIGACANPACGNKFPIYKLSVKTCCKACGYAVRNQRGEKNPSWGGGRINAGTGYIKIKMPGHPSADDNGYVFEHREVMERTLGRKLEPHERVHHRNGVRDDNQPENLELWMLKKKDPAGIRAADYHCTGCKCFD